jgi:hypothetical protein
MFNTKLKQQVDKLEEAVIKHFQEAEYVDTNKGSGMCFQTLKANDILCRFEELYEYLGVERSRKSQMRGTHHLVKMPKN